MGRTKEFNETKVLESAMRLFWKKGYSATSMKDLERVMGLTITSIYNTFGNKRALFEKALKHNAQHTIISVFLESLKKAKSSKQVMKATLDDVIDLHFKPSNPGGCLIVLSILENEQHDKKARKILDSVLRTLRDGVAQRLEKDKEKGILRPETNCRSIANQIIALRTGIVTMAKAGFSQKDLRKLSNDSIDALFNKHKL